MNRAAEQETPYGVGGASWLDPADQLCNHPYKQNNELREEVLSESQRGNAGMSSKFQNRGVNQKLKITLMQNSPRHDAMFDVRKIRK